MRILSILLLCALSAAAQKAPAKAKNVILFLADAGGVPTVNAASIVGYGEPQKLFLQSWPHIGLSDTSTASQWVSDSAAGMTAIVTGQKTHNGVISMGPDTVRGKQPGTRLKTILEYAEEKGLATGVLTNVNIADATPASCYAQADDRRKFGEIILQLFSPRFGDGADVVMGVGRTAVYNGVKGLNKDLDAAAREAKRTIYETVDAVPASDARPIVIAEKTIDLPAAARQALARLSKNKKGYFLMIEWDAHTDDPEKGLKNLVNFDKLIREIASTVNQKETLLLFTADHSFDLSTRGGKRGDDLLAGLNEWRAKSAAERGKYLELPALRVHGNHTGEEVVVAAMGPGAERVRGYMLNTKLFDIMRAAWGW
jgi:alkaline phosphatase